MAYRDLHNVRIVERIAQNLQNVAPFFCNILWTYMELQESTDILLYVTIVATSFANSFKIANNNKQLQLIVGLYHCNRNLWIIVIVNHRVFLTFSAGLDSLQRYE